MKVQDIKDNMICEGDYVNEDGSFHKIRNLEIHSDTDATVVLVGGGVMSIQDVSEDMIYLESEVA